MVKSKTFWGGLCSIAAGGFMIYRGNVTEGISLVAVGIQTIFLRDSNRKIEAKLK